MTELIMDNDFKNQKARRLKHLREIDKNQTKMIVENFRENCNEIQKNEEYLKIVTINLINFNSSKFIKVKAKRLEILKKKRKKYFKIFNKHQPMLKKITKFSWNI